jgi:hypothetical protein
MVVGVRCLGTRPTEEPMTEAAIAEHGLIRHLQTAASVGSDGSIDPPAPPRRTMAEQASAPGAVPVPAGTPAQTLR